MRGQFKQIDEDAWYDALSAFTARTKSKAEVCVDLGITRPTFVKWFTLFWENGSKTKGLPFIKQKDEKDEK